MAVGRKRVLVLSSRLLAEWQTEADLQYPSQKLHTLGCPAAHGASIYNSGLSFNKQKLYCRITKVYDSN